MHIRNEEELFQLGIKPALHINELERSYHTFDKTKIIGNYYETIQEFHFTHRGVDKVAKYHIFTRELISIPNDTEQFGILMGYPPKVCSLVKLRKEPSIHTVFLNYNGMTFNTMGCLAESLLWCNSQYGDKLRQIQGYIWYSIMEVQGEKTTKSHHLIY